MMFVFLFWAEHHTESQWLIDLLQSLHLLICDHEATTAQKQADVGAENVHRLWIQRMFGLYSCS